MGTTMDPSTLPYKVYDIDPDGDLLLGTKPDHEARWRFRVCSATLRRHSPVWKTMLFGPWKEAKPTDDSEWVVELPEDPAFEMQTTFHIIHGLFDKVPETMSINNLFNLLIVLNKYDMTRIVKPWCTQWVLPAEQPLAAVHALRSMYIAWELGHESLFTSRLAEIAMKTEIEGGALVFNDFQDVNLEAQDYLGPSDILDIIREIRKAVIEKMIAPLTADLEARVKTTPCCTFGNSWEKPERDRSLCDAAVLGSIYRGMIKQKGSILPRESSCITESVVQMASWLFPMMEDIQTPQYHRQCSLKDKYQKHSTTLHGSIPEIVQKFLKPSHKEYMASQRSKTGVASQPGTQITQRYWKLT